MRSGHPIWLAAIAACAAGCPRTLPGPPARPAGGGSTGTEPVLLLVAAPETSLWSGAGGTGSRVAVVHQGVEVRVVESRKTGWTRVETKADVRVEGWVGPSELGCRLTRKAPLLDGPGHPSAPTDPVARVGAMVRIIGRDGGWLHVESAPEKLVWYETGGKHDPVLEHVEYTGYVVRGWIEAGTCSAEQKPFYPRAPDDGTLKSIEEESAVHAEPGGLASRLDGRALPGTRWVVMESEGIWTRGRTDGQIVVRGWIPTSVVGPRPLTNPLYKLVRHEVKDYEVLGSQDLEDAGGEPLTTLAAGQDVRKLGEDVRGCKVATPPPVVVEGFVPCDALRDLSTLPEAAIEYGIIDGGAMPPERGPQPNPLPAE
jgi:hypothetical protein